MTRHPSLRNLVLAASLASAVGVAAQDAAPAAPPAAAAPAAAGAFVWHDLVTDNPALCRAFYGALFGWTFESAEGVDPGYTLIKHEDRLIGGMTPLTRRNRDDPAVAQWLAYVVVPDVDRAAEAFRQLGGRVVRGPLNARPDLRVAVVADPQGAPLGLASRGVRYDTDEETPPPVHRWLWMDYVALDPQAALGFYAAAVGFGHEARERRDDFVYHVLTTDRPRAGLFRSPWTRATSAWLPYVRVADPAAAAARAVELGGSIALAPAPSVRNGSLAIILDPTGAPLALQKFPFEIGATP